MNKSCKKHLGSFCSDFSTGGRVEEVSYQIGMYKYVWFIELSLGHMLYFQCYDCTTVRDSISLTTVQCMESWTLSPCK